ncbi:MAG: hypothetical protein DRQ51_06010 [Gammaproteobacteria bacterium]|nr:MAG: hypothetical protein DRQ51_06010 [Gammaproteobacteria bacterium]
MSSLYELIAVYKINKMCLFIAKIYHHERSEGLQRTCHFPYFCYKNALFSAFSKQQLIHAKASS